MKNIADLLAQVGEMVQKIRNQDQPIKDLKPEDLYQLEVLEKAVDFYTKLNTAVAQDSNVNLEVVKHQVMNSPETSKQDKQLLKQSEALEIEVQQMHRYLSKGLKKDIKNDSADEKDIKKRKKQFKRLGSDKGWIPL